MTPAERRADIAALRALGEREWQWLITHHEEQLRKEQKKHVDPR